MQKNHLIIISALCLISLVIFTFLYVQKKRETFIDEQCTTKDQTGILNRFKIAGREMNFYFKGATLTERHEPNIINNATSNLCKFANSKGTHVFFNENIVPYKIVSQCLKLNYMYASIRSLNNGRCKILTLFVQPSPEYDNDVLNLQLFDPLYVQFQFPNQQNAARSPAFIYWDSYLRRTEIQGRSVKAHHIRFLINHTTPNQFLNLANIFNRSVQKRIELLCYLTKNISDQSVSRGFTQEHYPLAPNFIVYREGAYQRDKAIKPNDNRVHFMEKYRSYLINNKFPTLTIKCQATIPNPISWTDVNNIKLKTEYGCDSLYYTHLFHFTNQRRTEDGQFQNIPFLGLNIYKASASPISYRVINIANRHESTFSITIPNGLFNASFGAVAIKSHSNDTYLYANTNNVCSLNRMNNRNKNNKRFSWTIKSVGGGAYVIYSNASTDGQKMYLNNNGVNYSVVNRRSDNDAPKYRIPNYNINNAYPSKYYLRLNMIGENHHAHYESMRLDPSLFEGNTLQKMNIICTIAPGQIYTFVKYLKAGREVVQIKRFNTVIPGLYNYNTNTPGKPINFWGNMYRTYAGLDNYKNRIMQQDLFAVIFFVKRSSETYNRLTVRMDSVTLGRVSFFEEAAKPIT